MTVKKQTLYAIQEDYFELMTQIQELDGFLTPELETALEINESELQKKSVGYLEVIKDRESFNDQIDYEIKRLQAMKKSNKGLIDTLKDRLLVAVNVFGEFTVGTLTFTTRKSTSIIISDEESLDKKFKTVTVTRSPDKKLIKEAINSGEIVIGAELSTNHSLRIK